MRFLLGSCQTCLSISGLKHSWSILHYPWIVFWVTMLWHADRELSWLISVRHFWRCLFVTRFFGWIFLLSAARWAIGRWRGSRFHLDLHLLCRPIALRGYANTILALRGPLFRCGLTTLLWRGNVPWVPWHWELLGSWRFILRLKLFWTLSSGLSLVNLRLALWGLKGLRVRYYLAGGGLFARRGDLVGSRAALGRLTRTIFLVSGLSLLGGCWLLEGCLITHVLLHCICHFVWVLLLVNLRWVALLWFVVGRLGQVIWTVRGGSLLLAIWLSGVSVMVRGGVICAWTFLYFRCRHFLKISNTRLKAFNWRLASRVGACSWRSIWSLLGAVATARSLVTLDLRARNMWWLRVEIGVGVLLLGSLWKRLGVAHLNLN